MREQRLGGRVDQLAADDQDADAAGGDPLERAVRGVDLVEAEAARDDGAQPHAGVEVGVGQQDLVGAQGDAGADLRDFVALG